MLLFIIIIIERDHIDVVKEGPNSTLNSIRARQSGNIGKGTLASVAFADTVGTPNLQLADSIYSVEDQIPPAAPNKSATIVHQSSQVDDLKDGWWMG